MTCDGEVSEVVSSLLTAVTESVDGDQKVTSYISYHRSPRLIGMCAYWNPSAPGIGGEFKQRYTDFLVHEITVDGKVVRLSNNNSPPFAAWLNQKSAKADPNDSDKKSINEAFIKCFDEKTYQQLESLGTADDGEDKNGAPVEFEASEDKDMRKQQHQAIKTLWPNLIAETINCPDGQRLIRVVRQRQQLKNSRRYAESRWPSDQRYCHFTLYKELLDTSAALGYLSKCMHVPLKSFTFAGMKDKRGSTAQRISADRLSAERIIGAVRSYPSSYCSNMMVSDFSYEPVPLRLGDLAGNHFQVALRNIQHPDMVDKACEAIRDFGFANYFGPQRFGTATSFSTADIGLLLLQCRWAEAIDAIFKAALEAKCDRGNDQRAIEAAAAWFERKDAETASRLFPGPYRSTERQMMQTLATSPTDFIGALRKLPRGLVLMYGHAYQSLIWNRVVARRIEKYGNTAVLTGDLVANGSICDLGEIDSGNIDGEFCDENTESSQTEVSYVKADDAANVSITDVILPLPGFNVSMPKNEIAGWYDEMLKADGVKFEECGRHMPELLLTGTYRPLMVKPSGMKWRVTSYDTSIDQLNITDRDAVLSLDSVKTTSNPNAKSALILEFQLPSCSYASVLVWELSKTPIPSQHIKTENVIDHIF